MRLRDLTLLIVVNLVWGVNFVAAGLALEGFPPIMANALRFIVVALLLSPFLRWIPGRMPLLFSAAFIFGVLHFGLMFIALNLIGDVSIVAVASQLNVPFSAILAVLVLREHVGIRRAVGMGIAFAGAAIIGFDPRAIDHLDGFALAVLSALCFSVAAVMLRRLAEVPSLTIQAWIGISAAVGSVFFSLLLEEGQQQALETAPEVAWAAILYSVFFSSLIGHVGMTYLLRNYDLAVISPSFLLTPVFALLASYLILGQTLTGLMWLGALMTLGGVAYINLRNSKRAQARHSATKE